MTPSLIVRDVQVFEGFLDADQQSKMVDAVRRIVRHAPLFDPHTPSGKPMSIRMTSAGSVGWITDRKGYRYSATHPAGGSWPEIPAEIMGVWKAVSGTAARPDCCLVNYYAHNAKMGMHQDKDEANFEHPVVSMSLGDDARFRIGNLSRGGKTETLVLRSGDVVVMGGKARRVYHGIDRISFGSSMLLPKSGRINLTLRVAL